MVLSDVFMKKYFFALASGCFALGFVWWLSAQSFYFEENVRSPNNTETPDDPAGLAAYHLERLRHPASGTIPRDIRREELKFAATLPVKNYAARSMEWQNRGPYNLGGRTRALAMDITDERIILAGQVTGGMWRSDDGGQNFTKTTSPQQIHSTTCIAQDVRPGHTNVWYYGTGEEYGVVSGSSFSARFSGDGIFKSTNGGRSWTLLPSTSSNTPHTRETKRDFDFVWEIVTNPANATQDEVYAAVINGIWRSTDGGSTWTATLGLDTAASGISIYTDIAVTSGGVLYAAISREGPGEIYGGIYRSTNGVNWTRITPPSFAASYRRIEIGIAPSDESLVYFIAQTPGTGATGHSLWKYRYLSGDGTGTGGKWTNLTGNIPNDHCYTWDNFDLQKFNSQSSFNLMVAVHPTDTNIVFLGGTNIYRSDDGFSTKKYDWIGGYRCDSATNFGGYSYPNHHSDQHQLIFLRSNTSVVLSGNDGGVIRTMDILSPVVSWTPLNNGYNTGQFYTCAIEPGNTNSEIIVGGLQDNGTYYTNTIDYTRPWPKVFYGDGSYAAITRNHTYFYLSWQNGKLYKLELNDDGSHRRRTRIDQQGASGYSFINPFILDPLDDNVMYVSGSVIRRNDSLNDIPIIENERLPITQGWRALQSTSTGNHLFAPKISSLDISEANTDLLYYGTSDGLVYRLPRCKTSTAPVKENITGSGFPFGAYVSCVETDRLDSNKVMVTFSNYGVKSIFYTEDGGQSWTDVSGNLEQFPDGSGNGPAVFWGHIYNDGTTLRYFAGTSTGLYSTDQLNGSQTVWTQEGPQSIGNVVVNMITSRTYDQTIVVATHGNGIYSNKIYTPSSVSNMNQAGFKLRFSPNPFTDRVEVIATRAFNGTFEGEVFDLKGSRVKNLGKSNRELILWDGRNENGEMSPSGIYLFRATDGKSIATARLVKL